MRFFLGFMMVCFVFPVFADEVRVSSFDFEDKPDFCERLSAHIPQDGVNYRVSSEGVVPADVSGSLKQPILDPIRIPVQIELLERLDLGVIEDIEGLDLETEVAAVEVYQDGRVLYNGQDISDKVRRTCDTPEVVPEPEETQESAEEVPESVIIPPKKPSIPEKPVDPSAIDVEILEGQFP